MLKSNIFEDILFDMKRLLLLLATFFLLSEAIAQVPIITYFTPTTAVAGETVTIKGHYFTGASSISFGGTAASSFSVLNDSTISAVVNNGTSGSIRVANPSGFVSKSGFIFASGCWKIVSNGFNYSQGFSFNIGIKTDGTLWSWGSNYYGQLGVGSRINKSIPVQIDTNNNWQSVSAFNGCSSRGIKKDGTLWGWGYNFIGYIDTINIDSVPVKIGTDNDWQSVSGNRAIKSNGTLWAWDQNIYTGQRPNGQIPLQIDSSTNWCLVSNGGGSTMALKTNGTLWAWGLNNFGQLGDGSTTNKSYPIQIGSSTNWQTVSSGSFHTMALKSDGTLWGWGRNNFGQLGDGTTTDRLSPIQIGSANDWISVSAGAYGTLAIKSNGTLWGWGYNYYGQLGNGNLYSQTPITTPIQIRNANDWRYVNTGSYHTVGIKTDGTLALWGSNNNGVLGNGSNISWSTPNNISCPLTSLPPLINSFAPAVGYQGSTIIIKGRYFTSTTSVSFGSSLANSFIVMNDSTISAIVGSGSTGNLYITTQNGTVSIAGFVYCAPPITNNITLNGCSSILFNMNLYTSSAIIRDTLRNNQGCDSVYNVTYINVNQITPRINDFVIKGCNSVVYKGVLYTAPTIVRDTIRSRFGCDSIYNVASIETACDGYLETVSDSVLNYFEDTVHVKIVIHSGVNVFSTYGYLSFDATYLTYLDSRMGSYLGNNVISQSPVVNGNQINFGMTKTFPQLGSNGDGTIYEFRFLRKNTLPSNIVFNANNPNSYKLPFTLSGISVYNSQGNQPASFNTLSIKSDTTLYRYSVSVWPGDLNNDKVVNVSDLLPIGYFYGSTGPARPNGNLQWTAQSSPLWGYDITTTHSSGYKCFADGNADGIIDLADQTSIGFSLSRTHSRSTFVSNPITVSSVFPTNQPAVNVNIPDVAISSGSLPLTEQVAFKIGSAAYPVNNLYGVAFDVYFDPSFVNTSNISFDYTNSVFGTQGVDYVKIEDLSNAGNGKISIALTRFNTTAINGNGGQLLNVNFPLVSPTTGGWFKVVAIPMAANDFVGNPLTVTGSVDSLKINMATPCTVNYWNGTESSAWENPSNWSCGSVPDATTEVHVEGLKPNYPVITSNAYCKKLINTSGALLTVATGYNLNIVGP